MRWYVNYFISIVKYTMNGKFCLCKNKHCMVYSKNESPTKILRNKVNKIQQVGKKNKITYVQVHLSLNFSRILCNQTWWWQQLWRKTFHKHHISYFKTCFILRHILQILYDKGVYSTSTLVVGYGTYWISEKNKRELFWD